MDLGIKGLRVIVTAGAAGIGREVARTFLREGALVHICDVDRTALAELATSDPKLKASVCDVSDRDAVARFIDATADALGGLPSSKIHCSVLASDAIRKVLTGF